MTTHLGEIVPGEEVNFKFTTVNTTPVPTALAGTPVVSVYRNGSLVQSTAGVTLTVDYDGVTGLNDVVVNTAVDPAFYYDRGTYQAVITTGTVGGTSVVGYVLAQWRMRQSIADQVWGASVGAIGSVSDSFASALTEIWNRIGSLLDVAVSSRGSAVEVAVTQGLVNDVRSRLPAALIAGRMASHTESAADGALTFFKFSQGFWDGVSAYVWGASVGQFASVSDSFAESMNDVRSRVHLLQQETMLAEFSTGTFGVNTITGPASLPSTDDYAVPSMIVIVDAATGAKTSNVTSSYDGATRTWTMQSDWPVTLTGTALVRVYPYGVDPASPADMGDALSTELDNGGSISWNEMISSVTTLVNSILTLQQIVNGVLDEPAASHQASGSVGAAISGGGTSPDLIAERVWGYAMGGFASVSDSFGEAVVRLSSQPASISGDDIRAAVGLGAANLDAQLAAQLAATPTAVQNADALLGRNVAGGADGGRTVASAFYKLRNKVSINQFTNVLTVFGTDDTTPVWTEQLTVDANAVPITGSDPA